MVEEIDVSKLWREESGDAQTISPTPLAPPLTKLTSPTNINMGKGYKLTSADGDGPKQCAFFFSDKGCRNGAVCKFSHEAAPPGGGAPSTSKNKTSPSVSSSSVMSSETESDGEIVETRAGAYSSMVAKNDDTNPFFSAVGAVVAPPPPAAVSAVPSAVASINNNATEPPTTEKKKKKRKKRSLSAGENPFELATETQAPNNAATAANQKGIVTPPPSVPQPKKQKATTTPAKETPQQSTSTPNNNATFRNLQLPIASFSLPISTAATTTPAAASKSPRPPSPQHEPAHAAPPLPLPVASANHLKWKNAVIATRDHANYDNAFNFERTKQLEFEQGISTPHHWITTRPYGDWCKNNPASIAIDCEMCETQDPVTGKTDTKALCRLSVINADNPTEVLLDTLVKPEWPVSNYRTWINGIKAKDLEGVQFTLRHAQMFMNALCSEQTVVVGHAVHNDLLALRMIHHCNADTAMLYNHSEEEGGTPSLKNLAYGVLKRDMPEVHDSVNDARVALACADHYCSKNGKVDPVEKVFSRNNGGGRDRDPADTAVLLVHRLPPTSQPGHIADMFLAYTCIKPKNVPEITFSGQHGKCHVEFTSKDHAELAYASLNGEEREDKTGKKQKRVGLKNGSYVCVRKMKKT